MAFWGGLPSPTMFLIFSNSCMVLKVAIEVPSSWQSDLAPEYSVLEVSYEFVIVVRYIVVVVVVTVLLVLPQEPQF